MPADQSTTIDEAAVETILAQGSLELEGRLVTASNASFVGEVSLDGTSLRCIYKPVQGERPLWDFTDGTLAGRERAARLVSDAGGWDVVPPTVLRDGRFGPGMCQRWIFVEADRALVDVVGSDFGESGWVAVLQAEDASGDPVLLVHKDDDRLRDMAVFDVVINNADRKGGHVLVESTGELWGCDHGVSFHEETKLRTVLWGWADDPLRPGDVDHLTRLVAALDGGLYDELSAFLTAAELEALRGRVETLLSTARMPLPEGHWPAIPWPAF